MPRPPRRSNQSNNPDGSNHPNSQNGSSNSQRGNNQNRPVRTGNNNNPNRPTRTGNNNNPNRSNNSNRPASNRPNRPGRPALPNQPAQAEQSAPAVQQKEVNSKRRPPNRRRGQNQTTNQRPRNNDENPYVPSVPRKAHGGIKARSEGGEFGKNWWAKRWLTAMERLMDGARLQRGRRYARIGQVLSMNETEEGGVVAKVQGSRPIPYKVAIRVAPFSDEQWEKVEDVLAGQAIFTAQLLAGEMPPNIEEAFSIAGVSLFPARGGDLMTECSCPDWANPCKHIAATHYILGDRFDEDPFLIFRLRGRTQEQILQALRLRRTGQGEVEPVEPETEEEPVPLDGDLAHFWEIGPGLDDYAVNVQRPNISLPLLKRLGQPDFARQYPLEVMLGPAYEAISQAAMLVAFSDIAREPAENGSETP